MKKIITFLLLYGFNIWAAPISEDTASLVAANFDAAYNNSDIRFETTLVYTFVTTKRTNAFYIFNIEKKRFVIVAADDRQEPILAYDINSIFDVEQISPELSYYFNNYQEEIQFLIDNNLIADTDTAEQWALLNSDVIPTMSTNKALTSTVGPLLNTCWGQSTPDNNLCPINTVSNCRAITGCVATAMSQIMNYWHYPQSGNGSYSYTWPNFGTLAANFGATMYGWSGSNADRALIMSHTGISVNMQYGCNSSGAWVLLNDQNGFHPRAAQNAYVSHFRYDSSIQGVLRSNYNYSSWRNLLKGEIDNGRPIQYAGWSNQGGHTWVCDGYQTNVFGVKFHMNWGWNCSNNGYFRIPGHSLGNQSYFPSNEQALVNIKPAPCPSNVVITGNYYNTITQSNTWIVSSGTTVIPTSSLVRLDAEPVNGFIQFNDGFSTQAGSVLIARALDGCGSALPTRMSSNTDFVNVDVKEKETKLIDRDLSISPNPSNGLFKIESLNSLQSIEVYDITGKTIWKKTDLNKDTNSFDVDLSTIQNGIYLIKINDTVVKKIVKQ